MSRISALLFRLRVYRTRFKNLEYYARQKKNEVLELEQEVKWLKHINQEIFGVYTTEDYAHDRKTICVTVDRVVLKRVNPEILYPQICRQLAYSIYK